MQKQRHVPPALLRRGLKRKRRKTALICTILIGIISFAIIVLNGRGIIHLSTIVSSVEGFITAMWAFWNASWPFFGNTILGGFSTNIISTLIALIALIVTIRNLPKRDSSPIAQPPGTTHGGRNAGFISRTLKNIDIKRRFNAIFATMVKFVRISFRSGPYEFTKDKTVRHASDLHLVRYKVHLAMQHKIPDRKSVAIVGGRKLGKSLMLKYIIREMKKPMWFRFRFRHVTDLVEINIGLPGCGTEDGLIRYIVQELKCEDFLSDANNTLDMDKLFPALRHLKLVRSGKIPVLCIDDLDKFKPPQFTEKFFQHLQAMAGSEFVLVVTSTNEMRTIDEQLDFFSYFIEPALFIEQEAKEFIKSKIKEIRDTDNTLFSEDEEKFWLDNTCSCSESEKRWHPLRMQIGGEILYEHKITHDPIDPNNDNDKTDFQNRLERDFNRLL